MNINIFRIVLVLIYIAIMILVFQKYQHDENIKDITVFNMLICAVVMALIDKYGAAYLRETALKKLAFTAGMVFDTDAKLLPRLEDGDLEFFYRGHSRKYSNLLTSSDAGGAAVYTFDYLYKTGVTDRRHNSHYHTLALFEFPQAIFPRFILSPKSLRDSPGEMPDFQDIWIDGYPAFSKEYTLCAPDMASALTFFTPEVIKYFEQNPRWCVQAAYQRIMVFKDTHSIYAEVSTGKYQNWMNEVRNLINVITMKQG